MRHRKAHRKLGRTSSHRQAMLKNMAAALIKHEQIMTTLAKAKELRPFTILIGIAGAIVGGFLGPFIGRGAVQSFDLGGIIIATGGAILLLILYRVLRKNRGGGAPPPAGPTTPAT